MIALYTEPKRPGNQISQNDIDLLLYHLDVTGVRYTFRGGLSHRGKAF